MTTTDVTGIAGFTWDQLKPLQLQNNPHIGLIHPHFVLSKMQNGFKFLPTFVLHIPFVTLQPFMCQKDTEIKKIPK